MAETVKVGRSPFLAAHSVESEADYKRKCVADKRIMMHAQIGFRDLEKSRRAFAEIWEALDRLGYRVDRYGICLDWSMGYPRAYRKNMPRGTGLILAEPEDWIAMTGMAPVAPHFGDFVTLDRPEHLSLGAADLSLVVADVLIDDRGKLWVLLLRPLDPARLT